MLDMAAQIFEIERTDAIRMAKAIEGLGRKGRKERAARNLQQVVATAPQSSKSYIERPTQHMLDRMMEASEPQWIDGEPFGVEGQLDIDPAQLLRKVVSAVISSGHASDLYEFPEVLAFFGSRNPERS